MRHVGALGPPPRRGPSAVAADGSNGNPTMGGHPGRSFVHRFRWRLREPPVGVPDRVRGVPRCWDTASPFWSITKDLREARCSSLGGRGGRVDALQHDGGPGRRSRGSRLDPGEGSGGSSWSSDRPRPCTSCGWLCRAWGWRRIGSDLRFIGLNPGLRGARCGGHARVGNGEGGPGPRHGVAVLSGVAWRGLRGQDLPAAVLGSVAGIPLVFVMVGVGRTAINPELAGPPRHLHHRSCFCR